jgi:cysteine desulfurase
VSAQRDCRVAADRANARPHRGDVLQAAPDAEIYGIGAPRVANTSFFALPGVKAETAQIAFDLAGVALSAGSACSSGKVGPSHVLKAMGFGDSAGALRVSSALPLSEAEVALFEVRWRAAGARRRKSREKAGGGLLGQWHSGPPIGGLPGANSRPERTIWTYAAPRCHSLKTAGP